jgi:hypothetical protein
MEWTDFVNPKLRKFPRLVEQMKWGKRLGAGIEGGTWKASFGSSSNDVFAVKVVRIPTLCRNE